MISTRVRFLALYHGANDKWSKRYSYLHKELPSSGGEAISICARPRLAAEAKPQGCREVKPNPLLVMASSVDISVISVRLEPWIHCHGWARDTP